MSYSEYNLRDHLSFEFKSLLGRLFLSRAPITSAEVKLLNLGCGMMSPGGWVNADFFVFTMVNRPDWMLDLRFPLRCPDNYWDGIFCEHTLEHLYPRHVKQLLSELCRTLKEGCYLRISVPDLEKYIDFYNGKKVHEMFTRKWQYPGEAIRSLSQGYSHLSLWDFSMLKAEMESAGYVNVERKQHGQGSDPRLLIDQESRSYESLYIEARKPF